MQASLDAARHGCAKSSAHVTPPPLSRRIRACGLSAARMHTCQLRRLGISTVYTRNAAAPAVAARVPAAQVPPPGRTPSKHGWLPRACALCPAAADLSDMHTRATCVCSSWAVRRLYHARMHARSVLSVGVCMARRARVGVLAGSSHGRLTRAPTQAAVLLAAGTPESCFRACGTVPTHPRLRSCNLAA